MLKLPETFITEEFFEIKNQYTANFVTTPKLKELIYFIKNCTTCILLNGLSGIGKTSLIKHCADVYGQKVITLYMGHHLEMNSLIGEIMISEIPGEFKWCPGIMTEAIINGYWVILDGLEHVTGDFLAILDGLLNNGCIYIPSINKQINFNSNFKIIITTNSKHIMNTLKRPVDMTKYITIIDLPFYSYKELTEVCYQRFMQLDNLLLETFIHIYIQIINTYNKIMNSACFYEPLNNDAILNSLARIKAPHLGLRDFFKVCLRFSNNLTKFIASSSDFCRLYIFSNIFDCLIAHFPDPDVRETLANVIGSELNMDINMVRHHLYEYKPHISLTPGHISCDTSLAVLNAPPFIKPFHPSTTVINGKSTNLPPVLDTSSTYYDTTPKKRSLSATSPPTVKYISSNKKRAIVKKNDLNFSKRNLDPRSCEHETDDITSTTPGMANGVKNVVTQKQCKFFLTRQACNVIRSAIEAIAQSEPLLLVGETGGGKTSLIQYLAEHYLVSSRVPKSSPNHSERKQLVVINMSNQTELEELYGSYRPQSLENTASSYGRSRKKNHGNVSSIHETQALFYECLLLNKQTIRDYEMLFAQTFSVHKNRTFLTNFRRILHNNLDVINNTNLATDLKSLHLQKPEIQSVDTQNIGDYKWAKIYSLMEFGCRTAIRKISHDLNKKRILNAGRQI